MTSMCIKSSLIVLVQKSGNIVWSGLMVFDMAGSKWRAPLPMDQNICAQGELPRFVRNFYDDCRGPPRLFLLDKYEAHLESYES